MEGDWMSKNSPQAERRKHPRVPYQESVVVHEVVESKSGNVFEVQGNPLVVKAKDLSEGGIRLEVGSKASDFKILKLEFRMSKNKSLDVYSKMAWVEKGMCGLQFIVADEEIRRVIRDFVEKTK